MRGVLCSALKRAVVGLEIRLHPFPKGRRPLATTTGGSGLKIRHTRTFMSSGDGNFYQEEVSGVKKKIEKVEDKIERVEKKIEQVEEMTWSKLDDEERAGFVQRTEFEQWKRDKEEKLQEEKRSLQDILTGLQDKENILLQQAIPAATQNVLKLDDLELDVSRVRFNSRSKHRLLGGFGADWAYQGSEFMVDQLAAPLLKHFKAWKRNDRDKGSHPIFLCFHGPGTGKSKFAEEFANLCVKAAEKKNASDLMERLRGPNVLEFRVSFENGTLLYETEMAPIMDIGKPVATRMVYEMLQLPHKRNFSSFREEIGSYSPDNVLDHVISKLGIEPQELTVFISVDGLQVASTDENKRSVYKALIGLTNTTSEREPFVVALATATRSGPQDKVLDASVSGQDRAYLTLPTVDWRAQFDISKCFRRARERFGSHSVEMLLDDMGGYGRAVEIAARNLDSLDHQSEDHENAKSLVHVVNSITNELGSKYKGLVHFFRGNGNYLLNLVLSQAPVFDDTRINPHDKGTVQDLLGLGLFQFTKESDQQRFVLSCPYILVHMSGFNEWKLDYYQVAAKHLRREKNDMGLENWAAFEDFVAKFRALKLNVLKSAGRDAVPLGELYPGAEFLNESDKTILVHLDSMPKSVECFSATKQAATKRTVYITRLSEKVSIVGNRTISPDRGVIRNVANAPGADVFQLVRVKANTTDGDMEWVMLNEQTKLRVRTTQNLSWSDIHAERKKSCDPEDILVVITTGGVNIDEANYNDRDEGKERTILVTKDNFQKVYGPYAGKAFFCMRQENWKQFAIPNDDKRIPI